MTSSSSRSRPPGEFELIAELFAPLAADAPGAFNLVDDAAVFAPPPGHDVVLKADGIIEGVHFFASDPPLAIAKKALRVNLSDLAAKGAVPKGYLLTLMLPSTIDMAWLREFARGFAEDQKQFGVVLYGGDTDRTPGPLAISIQAFGIVPAGTMIRRNGAKPGDLVFVTGSIGDAGGGLAILRGEGAGADAADRDALIARYRIPEPRTAFGASLRGLAHASIDVSDGLIADLGHVAAVSNVRIVVDAPLVPRSDALARLWGNSDEAIGRAAASGDDYEIAFTAPAFAEEAIRSASRAAATPVTRIGRVEEGKGTVLLDAGGREIKLARPGYTHF